MSIDRHKIPGVVTRTAAWKCGCVGTVSAMRASCSKERLQLALDEEAKYVGGITCPACSREAVPLESKP